MPVTHRKLKLIEFNLGTPPIQFECQVSAWNIANNTDDPEKLYTFCPDGEFYEDVDPAYALELTFFSSWVEDGISDWLQMHDGEEADFVLNHHPDIPAENVTWTGTCLIKAPNVGGEVRANETQEATLPCIGKPVYARVPVVP